MSKLDTEIREVKRELQELKRVVKSLESKGESAVLMWLSQTSLEGFLAGEPDLYTRSDLKVKYR